jgi:hypothetical protein
MFYPAHSKLLYFYRLFFIALFLLIGITGTGILLLECVAGIDIISTERAIDEQALYVSCGFMALFGLITALIMIYLMQEKRKTSIDRRRHDQPLSFADRRSNIDRRLR